MFGGLGDHQFAGLEERRRKRRAVDPVPLEQVPHRRYALALPRQTYDIQVVGARLLEREPHKFAAALYVGPVVEFIAHRSFTCAIFTDRSV